MCATDSRTPSAIKARLRPRVDKTPTDMATDAKETPQPTVHIGVVITVIVAIAVFALTGLCGTIYLSTTSKNPVLVQAAIELVKADPTQVLVALQLLQVNPATIAIVSGLTGTSIGILGTLLSNARTNSASQIAAAKNGGVQQVAVQQPVVTQDLKDLPPAERAAIEQAQNHPMGPPGPPPDAPAPPWQ
jgi:hypothetical protein